jgi:hypothetical protein
MYDGSLAARISGALERDPGASGRDFRKQFDYHLIAQLVQLVMTGKAPIPIVIDALDGCGKDGARAMLSPPAYEVLRISRLRVFISARPEPHIRSVLAQYRDHKQFHIEQSIVEADIHRYPEYRLPEQGVRTALPDLPPPPWQLTKEQAPAKSLVGMSGKPFITVADFILGTQSLEKR